MKRIILTEEQYKLLTEKKLSKFLEKFKEVFYDADDNSYHSPFNFYKAKKEIKNWPDISYFEGGYHVNDPKMKGKDKSLISTEALDLENHEAINLTSDKFVFTSNGDWQPEFTVTIKLVNDNLKVTDCHPYKKGDGKSIKTTDMLKTLDIYDEYMEIKKQKEDEQFQKDCERYAEEYKELDETNQKPSDDSVKKFFTDKYEHKKQTNKLIKTTLEKILNMKKQIIEGKASHLPDEGDGYWDRMGDITDEIEKQLNKLYTKKEKPSNEKFDRAGVIINFIKNGFNLKADYYYKTIKDLEDVMNDKEYSGSYSNSYMLYKYVTMIKDILSKIVDGEEKNNTIVVKSELIKQLNNIDKKYNIENKKNINNQKKMYITKENILDKTTLTKLIEKILDETNFTLDGDDPDLKNKINDIKNDNSLYDENKDDIVVKNGDVESSINATNEQKTLTKKDINKMVLEKKYNAKVLTKKELFEETVGYGDFKTNKNNLPEKFSDVKSLPMAKTWLQNKYGENFKGSDLTDDEIDIFQNIKKTDKEGFNNFK